MSFGRRRGRWFRKIGHVCKFEKRVEKKNSYKVEGVFCVFLLGNNYFVTRHEEVYIYIV